MHFDARTPHVTAADVAPAIDAYDASFGLFRCATCGPLAVRTAQEHDAELCCRCGQISFSLRGKK